MSAGHFSPGGHRRFSADEIRRMKQARDDGVSMVDIGRRFGIGHTKVRKLIESAAFVQVEGENRVDAVVRSQEEMVAILRAVS